LMCAVASATRSQGWGGAGRPAVRSAQPHTWQARPSRRYACTPFALQGALNPVLWGSRLDHGKRSVNATSETPPNGNQAATCRSISEALTKVLEVVLSALLSLAHQARVSPFGGYDLIAPAVGRPSLAVPGHQLDDTERRFAACWIPRRNRHRHYQDHRERPPAFCR
jgi:hypothetical protein